MASLNGSVSGLTPVAAPVKVVVKQAKKSEQWECAACGARGEVHSRASKNAYIEQDGEEYCTQCAKFFGLVDNWGGSTNYSVKQTKAKIAKVHEEKYAMMLITQTFSGPGGQSLKVEAGDVFPLNNLPFKAEGTGPSWERTKGMFTITLNIGEVSLTLFPHEFSAMNFLTVMELRGAGEIVEAFVSPEDTTGYFQPVPEIRKQIQQAFGL